MAMVKKHHRLKEPSVSEVEQSVEALVARAARAVHRDHRGDVEVAEHVMLTVVYLQRAIDALTDRRTAKQLVVAACSSVFEGNGTVH